MRNIDIQRFRDYASINREILAISVDEEPIPPYYSVTPIMFKVCNYSSATFFAIQALYSSYLLYKLLFKNERSKALITAIVMMIYSSLALSVFFVLADMSFMENTDDQSTQIYYITVNELPFLFIFMSHWIVFY